MTTAYDDIRRRVGVLSGDALTVKVPQEIVDGDHSFRSIARGGNNPDGIVTVKLEAGHTRLQVSHAAVTFDGYRYFPRVPDDYDTVDYRGDVGDASIDWVEDVSDFAAASPLRNMTVDGLVVGLSDGTIGPLPWEA